MALKPHNSNQIITELLNRRTFLNTCSGAEKPPERRNAIATPQEKEKMQVWEADVVFTAFLFHQKSSLKYIYQTNLTQRFSLCYQPQFH